MPKILIIEDAEPLRNDIMEMLSFEDYEVRGAENGRIGVEVARDYQPDLIICDIMMPELDGYGVLEALSKDARTVSIPFIFLTAKTDRVDQRRGMGLGADDYLTKPFGAEELLDTINARLKKVAITTTLIESRIEELSNSIITALPHELRTPLNTIIGFSDMLIAESETITSDLVLEWSTLINQAGQRLYHLIENYLLYVKLAVRLERGEEIQKMRDSVLEYPDSVIHSYATDKAKKVDREDDLDLELSGGVAIRIQDSDLGKIVDELLDNAFKASQRGESVRVEAAVEDDHYVLRIADQGYGMTDEEIKSIGPLVQLDRWLNEREGLGLGLMIVKQLLEIYSGDDLTINSIPGKGTTVIARFEIG